jgi:hypothetical protein
MMRRGTVRALGEGVSGILAMMTMTGMMTIGMIGMTMIGMMMSMMRNLHVTA